MVCRGQLPVSWITRKAVSIYLFFLSQCYRFYSKFVLYLTIRPLNLQEGLHGPLCCWMVLWGGINNLASKKILLLQRIIFGLLLLLLLLTFWLGTNSSWELAPWWCLPTGMGVYLPSLWESRGFGGNGGCSFNSIPQIIFQCLLFSPLLFPSLRASSWGSFSSCATVITVIVLASSGISMPSCISKMV